MPKRKKRVYDLSKPIRLTPKDIKIYKYLVFFSESYGDMPNFREVCQHFGWRSSFAPFESYGRLILCGLLQNHEGLNRSARFARPIDPSFVRIHYESSWIDLHRSVLTNDTKNVELVEYKDHLLLVTQDLPRMGGVAIRRDYKLAGYFFDKHIVPLGTTSFRNTRNWKFLRVAAILQPQLQGL